MATLRRPGEKSVAAAGGSESESFGRRLNPELSLDPAQLERDLTNIQAQLAESKALLEALLLFAKTLQQMTELDSMYSRFVENALVPCAHSKLLHDNTRTATLILANSMTVYRNSMVNVRRDVHNRLMTSITVTLEIVKDCAALRVPADRARQAWEQLQAQVNQNHKQNFGSDANAQFNKLMQLERERDAARRAYEREALYAIYQLSALAQRVETEAFDKSLAITQTFSTTLTETERSFNDVAGKVPDVRERHAEWLKKSVEERMAERYPDIWVAPAPSNQVPLSSAAGTPPSSTATITYGSPSSATAPQSGLSAAASSAGSALAGWRQGGVRPSPSTSMSSPQPAASAPVLSTATGQPSLLFPTSTVASSTPALSISGSLSPALGGGVGKVYKFEVQKVKKKLKANSKKVLEVDLALCTVASYNVRKQKRTAHDADSIVKMQRSNINPRKLKVFWSDRDLPTRFLFESSADRERFVEAARFAARGAVDGGSQQSTEVITVWTGTWNMGSAPPPADLSAWMPRDVADLYVCSVQECDYAPPDGAQSCEEHLFGVVAQHLGEDYVKIAQQSLLAIRLVVLVRKSHYYKITQLRTNKEATGIGGIYGNKGAVGMSCNFNDTSLCFIGSHLAAREERVKQRQQNVEDILRGLHLAKEPFDVSNFFHHVFWLGDLNYRVTMPRDKTIDLLAQGRIAEVLATDQLNRERAAGNVFVGWSEGLIGFPPSYRYNRGDRTWSDEKMRTPSWCDRVLWKSLPGCTAQQIQYDICNELMTSDHSPVSALFCLMTNVPALPSDDPPPRLRLTNVSLDLKPSAMESGKVPSPTLTFAGVTDVPKSTPSVPKTLSARWADTALPQLDPLVNTREAMRHQHLQILVRDNNVDNLGQAMVSLREAVAGADEFEVPVTRCGRVTGTVRGTIWVNWRSAVESAIVQSGYLLKQGGQRKNWKRRWFELSSAEGGTMSYFESKGSKSLGTFSVAGAAISTEPVTTGGKQNCLTIATVTKRTWVLCADSADQATSWIRHLLTFAAPVVLPLAAPVAAAPAAPVAAAPAAQVGVSLSRASSASGLASRGGTNTLAAQAQVRAAPRPGSVQSTPATPATLAVAWSSVLEPAEPGSSAVATVTGKMSPRHTGDDLPPPYSPSPASSSSSSSLSAGSPVASLSKSAPFDEPEPGEPLSPRERAQARAIVSPRSVEDASVEVPMRARATRVELPSETAARIEAGRTAGSAAAAGGSAGWTATRPRQQAD